MGPAVQLSSPNAIAVGHQCVDLVTLFEWCFAAEFNTRLVPGGAEPEYLPPDANASHGRVIFKLDYFASALHEIAHWCLAGAARRRLPDYGYWYAPDGRTAEQQREFERVEVKPQALEWVFSEAACAPFKISADNLNQRLGASATFKEAVAAQARAYAKGGLPRRAALFSEALMRYYGGVLSPERFAADRI